MKEMDLKTLRAAYAGLSEADDEDDGDEDKSESLSRNALIRGVVESLKDKSVKEVQSFIKGISEDASEDDRDEDKGESEKIQKKSTPVKTLETWQRRWKQNSIQRLLFLWSLRI